MKAQQKATKCTDAVVDYKKGVMELDWKPGQRFDYPAIKKAAVRGADLTLKGVTVTARGNVAKEGTNVVLHVTGTKEKFVLEENRAGELAKVVEAGKDGSAVTVTGDIRENKQGNVAALVVPPRESVK